MVVKRKAARAPDLRKLYIDQDLGVAPKGTGSGVTEWAYWQKFMPVWPYLVAHWGYQRARNWLFTADPELDGLSPRDAINQGRLDKVSRAIANHVQMPGLRQALGAMMLPILLPFAGLAYTFATA
jgi:hypothetical protein